MKFIVRTVSLNRDFLEWFRYKLSTSTFMQFEKFEKVRFELNVK
jgi:hypothetical protein